jgi:DNA-binding LacI/PurR family transcriptional regulator
VNPRHETTKKEAIGGELREAILSGTFAGGQLPFKLDLARHFGVSHRTIEPVLRQLQDEGLIRCVKGAGTFVNTDVQEVANLTSSMVLLLMPLYSILGNDSFNALRQEAFRRSLLPVNLPAPEKYVKLTLQEKSILTRTLKAPIRGVLYNGYCYRREPFLDNWKNVRSVALTDLSGTNDPPGSSLLIDFEAGAEKIAEHFIENGCRKLLILSGYIDPVLFKDEKVCEKLMFRKFFRGVSRAAKAAGIAPPTLYCVRNSTPPNDFATESIGLPEAEQLLRKFDGIITTYDNLAYCMIRHAGALGLKVPEDLMISACSNTGWTYRFDYRITTLSDMSEQLASKAFDMLEAGGICHDMIEPDLIVRKSSMR